MMDVPKRLREVLAPRYVLEREIGAGGMARVYLATEDHPHRKVAIKVLDPDLCTRLFRERFLREVELASNLSHPHIVPVFAAGGVDCYLYYVMPYIEGESLRHRLERDGRLPLGDALHIAGDVADALGHAHANGIIHRDIKPENILLSGGHAVVADFGIARAISAAGQPALTQTGQPIGSTNYMSPEQAFGSASLDARTDVYSLGCVLFEMLTGELPARNPLDPRVQNWELLDRSPGLRDTGSGGRRGVKHAISAALRPSPDERFTTIAEFAAALGVSREPQPAVPYRLIPNRVWHATLVGAAAIAVVGAGVALTAGRRAALHRDRVVVAVIENHTGDPALDNLGHMAADWVTQGLAQTGLLEVVPSTVAMSAEHSAGHGPGHLDVHDIRALGRRTGAGTVVSGAYYRQADSVRFQLQITDTRDGRVIRALDPVAGPTAQPLGALDVLRQRVMAALAVWVDPKLMGWASAASQPPTFDAYQEFVEGLDALTRSDWARARDHLERAAAHDSTFASARLWAAFARFNLGEFATVDSVTRTLYQSTGRLAPFDQAILTWLSAWVRGDPESGLAAARQAAALAPASGFQVLVAWDALVVNRPAEALAALRDLTPDHPLLQGAPTYWGVQTGARHALGDYRAELADARAARRRFPDALSVRADELRALAARGDVAALAARLDESLSLSPQSEWTPADVALLTALELRAHGHEQAAGATLERAAGWLATRSPDELAAGVQYRHALALTHYLAGRLDEAQRLFTHLLADAPHGPAGHAALGVGPGSLGDLPDAITYRGYLGVIAARRGDGAAARRLAQALAAERGPYLFGRPAVWRARIHALLGERDQAVALLREGLSQGFHFNPRFHPDVALDVLRDYPPFRELTRPKG